VSNPIEATVASYLGTAKIEWGKLKPVMCFVILWNRLEASSGNFLNLEALQEKAHAVAAKPDIQIERYDPHIDYFRRRYGDDVNYIDRLMFWRGKREAKAKELVSRLLTGQDLDRQERLEAILMVPYRIRNNLFH
jgi:hypothetical protein